MSFKVNQISHSSSLSDVIKSNYSHSVSRFQVGEIDADAARRINQITSFPQLTPSTTLMSQRAFGTTALTQSSNTPSPNESPERKPLREILTWKACKKEFIPILKFNLFAAVGYAVLAVLYTSSSLPSDEEVAANKKDSKKA